MKSKFKTIGIIGGMGPQATIDMYQEILNNTNASVDQEHLPVIIYSLPQIPSRVDAILDNKESPVPTIVNAIKTLKGGGVEIFIMACNAAHYFQNEIEEKCDIKLLSIIDETLNYIQTTYPNVRKVGLLARTATARTRVYERTENIELILPNYEEQNRIDNVIAGKNGIKEGNLGIVPKNKLESAAKHLKDKGAEIIIMGCTEIPLVLKEENCNIPLINPTRILAQRAIEESVQTKRIYKYSNPFHNKSHLRLISNS